MKVWERICPLFMPISFASSVDHALTIMCVCVPVSVYVSESRGQFSSDCQEH